MVLELRPNCESCDTDLPPSAVNARICSYECTFCASCVEDVLQSVCPNCGGSFTPRPIRPAKEWVSGVFVRARPASEKRVHMKRSKEEAETLTAKVRAVKPEDR